MSGNPCERDHQVGICLTALGLFVKSCDVSFDFVDEVLRWV